MSAGPLFPASSLGPQRMELTTKEQQHGLELAMRKQLLHAWPYVGRDRFRVIIAVPTLVR